MKYEFKCTNKKCTKLDRHLTFDISVNEYSEERFPKCECCGHKMSRVWTSPGIKTAGDGYKS